MAYRSIVLALNSQNEPTLHTRVIEETWSRAQSIHDGLRAEVHERRETIIYNSLIDTSRPIASCCSGSGRVLA
jgi:hypothetical protein